MTPLNALLRRARLRAVTYASTRPKLYFGIRRLSRRMDPLCIRPDTDIVIEGYPRSANSTIAHGFIARQDAPLHVAHHKHHAAQILRATDWEIPAVVLIRPPRAACLSLMALEAEARYRAGKEAISALTFEDAFSAYVAFYEAVEPRLDHTVIGRFEVMRDDLPGLVARVNARFGTCFCSAPREDKSRSDLGWHAMPNEIRDGIKGDLVGRFETQLGTSPTLRGLVARAEAVHARYVKVDEHAG